MNNLVIVSVLCYLLIFFSEMEELAKHGVCLPPNMQGLTDDQVKDLKLVDEWGEKCVPSGGFEERRDEMGRRNGKGVLVIKIYFLLCYC